jgi:xanthine dehydrogenase YagT iron-sulfur-binding subunit
MKDDDPPKFEPSSGLTRRDFMKVSSIGVAVPLVLGPTLVHAAGEDLAVFGPGKAVVTLTVNGRKLTAELEPRVTLLDALRDNFDLTGAKRVCDRGVCGSCTVLLKGSRFMPARYWRSMRKAKASQRLKVWLRATLSLR